MLETATIGGVDGVQALPAPWMNRRGRQSHWWAGPAPCRSKAQGKQGGFPFLFILRFIFIYFCFTFSYCFAISIKGKGILVQQGT